MKLGGLLVTFFTLAVAFYRWHYDSEVPQLRAPLRSAALRRPIRCGPTRDPRWLQR
jgi:hypothetical protein